MNWKKKAIAMLLAVAMTISACPVAAWAEELPQESVSADGVTSGATSEGLEFVTEDKASCYVSGIGTCADTDIVIPAEYHGLPVTAIGDYAFSSCSDLTSVAIPEGVTYIGDESFYGCTSLASVTIPGSVTSIGAYAFAHCQSLAEIYFGGSQTQWDAIARSDGWDTDTPDYTVYFGGADVSETPAVDPAILQEGMEAYYSLIELMGDYFAAGELPTSVLTHTFRNACYESGSFAEYLSYEPIDDYGGQNITGQIPGEVVEAFLGEHLTDQELLNSYLRSYTDLESNFWAYMDGEYHVSLNNYGGFGDYLPEFVYIGYEAVDDAYVAYGYRVDTIHYETDYSEYIPTADEIPGVDYILIATESGVQYAKLRSQGIKAVMTIKNGTYAFTAYELVDTNTIPMLKNHVHSYLVRVTQPTCTQQGYNDYICVCGDAYRDTYTEAIGHSFVDGVCEHCGLTESGESLDFVLSEDGTYYVSGIGTCTDTDIVIPAEYNGIPVTGIGDSAFNQCSSLTSITIPDSVTEIGYGVFYGCTSLTSVTIPDSVTWIGAWAFEACYNLTSITIPNSVVRIGNGTFYNCSGLTDVVIGSGVFSIDNYAFNNCSNLTSITIPDSVTDIGDFAFRGSGLTSITIPDSVTWIGEYAFAECSELMSINIPQGVTYMGAAVFAQCGNLLSIVIPEGVTSIEAASFENCYSMTSIVIPDSVTWIGSYALNGCSGLEEIYFGGSLEQWNAIDKQENWDYNTDDYVIYFNGEAHEHSLTATVVAPTCGEQGYTIYACACGYSYLDDYTPALGGHASMQQIVAVEPTCEMDGNIACWYCPDCNRYYADQAATEELYAEDVVLLALGHDYQNGTCTRCGAEVIDERFPVNIASPGEEVYIEFTPDVSGQYYIYSHAAEDTYGYLYDADMNQLTSNDDSAGELNFLISWYLEAGATYYIGARYYSGDRIGTFLVHVSTEFVGGHTYVHNVVAPGCVTEGYHLYRCEECGAEYKENETPALGHDFQDGTCTRCGQELSEELMLAEIESAGDVAIFPFVPETSGTYYFYSDSQYDTYGYVYDADMNVLASNDDGIGGYDFLITYEFEAGETYYLGATFLDSSYTGHFYVRITNDLGSGHSYVCLEGTGPTCTENGYYVYECLLCGETYEDYQVYALDHDYEDNVCIRCGKEITGDWLRVEIAVPGEIATIEFIPETSGTYRFYSDSVMDAYGYIYDANMNQLAYDDDNGGNYNFSMDYFFEAGKTYYLGARYYSPELTGHYYVRITNEQDADHDYEFIGQVEPTCTSSGYDLYRCTECGAEYQTNWVNSYGHSYELLETVEPTCTTNGYSVYQCQRCGETYEDSFAAVLDHEYKDNVCARCGKEITGDWILVEIEGPGDTAIFEFIPEVSGYYRFYSDAVRDVYGYIYDADMNELIYNDDGGENLNFSMDYFLEAGKTYYLGARFYSSSEMGQFCVRITDEFDSAHSYELVETVEPTCTTDGYTLYACTHCDRTYQTNWVAAYGHTQGELVATVLPTCSTDGYTIYLCAECGEEYNTDWVQATGHTMGEQVTVVAPTCTEKGYTSYMCLVCNAEYMTQWVPALRHSFEEDVCVNCNRPYDECIESLHDYENNCDESWTIYKPGVETITVTFSSDTYVESNFDYIYIYDMNDNEIGRYTGSDLASRQITVSGDTVKIRLTTDGSVTAYGFAVVEIRTNVESHERIVWVQAVSPTCEVAGHIAYWFCPDCNRYFADQDATQELTYEEIILQPLGHTEVIDGAVAPTCTQIGLTAGKHCSVCGEILEAQNAIAALGHAYIVADTAPTCTAAGYTTHSCERCAYTYRDNYVDALGHTYDQWTTIREPSCTQIGWQVRTCAVCRSQDTAALPAKGHDYVSTVVAPTCTEQGYTEHECSVCAASYRDTYVAANGHSYGAWVIDTEATVLAEGAKHRNCGICGYRQETTIERIAIDINTNENYGLVNFTVVNAQTLEPIPNAQIFISTEKDGENTFFTDAQGKVSVILPVGKQAISVYASDCLTRNLNITVKPGVNDIQQIGLSDRPTYDAEITSTLMTIEEIQEAGIDTTDPGNQHVYKYELKLEFEAEIDVYSIMYYFNGDGKLILPDWGNGSSNPGGSSGSGGNGISYVPGGIRIELKNEEVVTVYPVNEYFYLIIRGEITWLKEMFDVEMLIINNSNTDTLEDLTATLNLPEGLSLAAMVGEQQTLAQKIDLIAEGESKSVHWYVRGDAAGSYSLEARLQGMVMPFEEPIDDLFVAEDKLQVWAGDAMHLHFEFPNAAYHAEDYPIRITLENVSDITLYNINHMVQIEQGMKVYYSDGTSKERIETSEWESVGVEKFNPGDQIIIEVDVNIFFESEVIQWELEKLIGIVDGIEQLINAIDAIQTVLDITKGLMNCVDGCVEALDNFDFSSVTNMSKLKLFKELYKNISELASSYATSGDKTIDAAVGLTNTGIIAVLDAITSDPAEWLENNSIEDIMDLLEQVHTLQSSLESSEDTTKKFNIFDSIRTAISAIPIRFVLTNVIMTEDENNTTSIPWSYSVYDAGPQYFGVSNVSKYLNALTQAALGAVYDEAMPWYLQLIPGLDDPFNQEEAIKYIQATEKEIAQVKAKDATGKVTFKAWIERNTSAARATSIIVSDDFMLSCDNENAVYENGVLTFTGDSMISIIPQSSSIGGILYIEDSEGNLYTYVLDVVEQHTCVAGEQEVIIAPTAGCDGFAVKCCETCSEIMEIVPLDYENCCTEHTFGAWIVTAEATYFDQGLQNRTCTACGYMEYQFMEKVAHPCTEYTVLNKDETHHWYECDVCGAEDPAGRTAHFGGEANCAQQAVCEVCNTAYGALDETKHEYESVVTEPTATLQGYTTHTCKICGDSYVDSYVRPMGDVNGDGKVSATDYSIVARIVKGLTIITDEEVLYYADMNGDGRITAADYNLLARIVKGLYRP